MFNRVGRATFKEITLTFLESWGFPGSSDSKESACNAGDLGLNHAEGRSPGEGTGNPLQYSSEKAIAPYSSTLAWKIPWMEEPGRLQSMGSLRVGHD